MYSPRAFVSAASAAPHNAGSRSPPPRRRRRRHTPPTHTHQQHVALTCFLHPHLSTGSSTKLTSVGLLLGASLLVALAIVVAIATTTVAIAVVVTSAPFGLLVLIRVLFDVTTRVLVLTRVA